MVQAEPTPVKEKEKEFSIADLIAQQNRLMAQAPSTDIKDRVAVLENEVRMLRNAVKEMQDLYTKPTAKKAG
jgi:hypothetical protein